MKLKRKDLDKRISASIKKELKKYKLISRGGIYYKKIGQYFIYICILVRLVWKMILLELEGM